MGWRTRGFPKTGGAKAASSGSDPERDYVPISQPDLTQYVVPKFRGLHYRTEKTSRFFGEEAYRAHSTESQVGQPSFSAAVYGLSTPSPSDPRPRVKQEYFRPSRRSYRLGGRRVPGSEVELPPLAADVALREVHGKKRRRPQPKGGPYGGKVPAMRSSQYQLEQQSYVNTMEKFVRTHREAGGLPGIPQISTSDSPYHASLYSLGEKFTTEGQSAAKRRKKASEVAKPPAKSSSAAAKRRQSRRRRPGMLGGRRTRGVVGKTQTFLFTPVELHSLDPAVVPLMQHREEVAIHPHQRWELESTFHGEIPGHHFVAESRADIDPAEQERYEKISDEPRGSAFRQRKARKLGRTVWEAAQEEAERRRKLLVPHGVLHAMAGGDLAGLVEKRLHEERQRAHEALERLATRKRPREDGD